jgi:deoxyribodipyrimidine photo-lyase
MRCAVVVFTRDLRVHDNPALSAAAEVAERVLPVFVHDPAIRSSPNRDAFLAGCLVDLRAGLRGLGADLVVRSGDPVTEVLRLARAVDADGVTIAADVSPYARRRAGRLAAACARERLAFREFPGLSVVPPQQLRPAGGRGWYQVFTPYHRAWRAAAWRPVLAPPALLKLPATAVEPGPVGARVRPTAPGATPGGERAARHRLRHWRALVDAYPDGHDDLAGEATSRLSAALRFGCLSPRELAAAVPGAEAFLRQLCWRDFYHQLLAGYPQLARAPLRGPARQVWRDDAGALRRWRDGQTGVPIVDAGMRQLAAEGFMHNRARLITAGFLTKYLGLDWRAGLAVFAAALLDADAANNPGNWQWVAGVGTDTKPYRGFNPIRQAHRFDPTGDYVRRYLPELAGVPGAAVHEPWRLSGLHYPPPLRGPVDVPWLPSASAMG